MRIEHIRVAGYGRLVGFDTGPKRLGALVVVLGPNEAGKSTLFSFLTTALFGFQPASRELSPFVPWGADEASGEISLRLADGTCASISRRLRSSPSGTLTVGEESRELRNQPVRWVEHVPRTVFRQVFAITLAELAGLDEAMWAGIQDRVLGSMGASDLHSPREVAEVLEREAGEIWRPNRRGNQSLRNLQERIRALRARRTEALERDREIRRLVEERESVRLRLQDAREERLREKVELERIQELLPLKRQLERIAALRSEGGQRDRLKGLPPDLAQRRRSLMDRRATLEGELRALEVEGAEPAAALAAFDERCRELVTHEGIIEALGERLETVRGDRLRHEEISTRAREITVQLRTQAELLLEQPWSDALSEVVASVSHDLLRDRVQRLEEIVGPGAPDGPSGEGRPTPRRRPTLQGAESAPGEGGDRPVMAAVALVAVGAGLLAWGLSGGPTIATVLGAAALAAGVLLGWTARSTPAARSMSLPGPDVGRRERLSAEIREMVAGIPVRAEYLQPPGSPLVSGLARLQDLARREVEVRSARQLHADRMAGFAAKTAEVAARLGLEVDADTWDVARALDTAQALGRELREATGRRDEARVAERVQARLDRDGQRMRTEVAELDEQLARLDARVRAINLPPSPSGQLDVLDTATPVDADELDRAQARLDAHARADRLREELETLHPNLDELMTRIREADESGATWTRDEEEVASRKVRLELLNETIEQLVAKAESLDNSVARLRDMETVDEVDGEVDSLREEEARLIRERDRKWLLARLLREADRRFREEHQPDLIRRASEYLGRLTAGRYDRLLVDEDGKGDLFQLMGPQLPAPVPLARPISTGTLEQAYLGLRLAIVDHLDHGEQRLPLFMDEAFVNWDEERREQGLAVLAEVAQTRQVFAFTCHPEMAENLARRGACVLRLQ